MAKPGTIVVDNLPSNCTTFQLFAAFSLHGTVLRAWRSQENQGLVTFMDTKCAIQAVKEEHGKKLLNKELVVTAAFFNTSEMRPGWWQCSLCRSWNEKSSTVYCSGYMCGLQDTEGGISTWVKQADEVKSEHGSLISILANGEYTQAETTEAQDANSQEYYGYDQQPGYRTQDVYQGYAHDEGINGMNTQYAEEVNGMDNTYMEGYNGNGRQANGGAYPQRRQNGVAASGSVNASGSSNGSQRHPNGSFDCSAPLRIMPMASALRYYCVIISNVPSNITNYTLDKVFAKFGHIHSWVRPPPGNLPRLIAEGQVLFETEEAANEAVEGESGHMVDKERIWCTYASELFIVSVTGAAAEEYAWNAAMTSDNAKSLISNISDLFTEYGFINDVTVADNKVIFIEYYSLSSMLDAIAGEDGGRKVGVGFTLDVAVASGGTRWPCVSPGCFRVNPSYAGCCESCQSPRQPINAKILRETIFKAALDSQGTEYFGDSYRGYCRSLQGYMGQNLQEVRPEPRNGLGNAAGNGMPAGQGHEGAGQAGGSVSQQQQQQQQVPQLAAAPPGGEAYFSGGHNLPPTAHHDQNERPAAPSTPASYSGGWGSSKGGKGGGGGGGSGWGTSTGKGGKAAFSQRPANGYSPTFPAAGKGGAVRPVVNQNGYSRRHDERKL